MITATALLLLAVQGAAEEPKPILVDLAALEPGPLHTIAVVGERPFTAELVNRVPGAAYRVIQMARGGGGSSVGLNPHGPEDLGLRSWGEAPGCADAVQAVRDVLAATDEARVGALLAAGGPVETALARPGCPGSERARTDVSRITGGHAVQSSGLAMSEWLALRVERSASAVSPARTWLIRFEATSEPKFAWAWGNEASWLASEIASDLAEMAAFALGKAVAVPGVAIATDASSGQLTFAGGSPRALTIPLDDSVWSPRAWEPVARRLLGATARSSSKPEDAPVPDALTDPQALSLERENQRISAWLARDMRSPGAHEQAALLLASFALREAAGTFSDTRPALGRLTAHLALARALRAGAPAGRSGVFAEAARLVLIGRQQDAIAALDRAGATTAAERAWSNALRLRVTGDWRILAQPLTATLLERREHYRALDRSLGDRHALDFLERRNVEAVPDWGRIVVGSASVAAGNRFASQMPALELAEAAAVYHQSQGGELAGPELVARLNEPPGRCVGRAKDGRPRPRVLDWGSWASSSRRHLLHAVASADDHVFRMLGLPDEADEAWTKAQEALKGLELLPLVAVRVSSQRKAAASGASRPGSLPPTTAAGCGEATPVVATHPEKITAAAWSLLKRDCTRPVEVARLAGERRWFGSSLPPGTAFESAARRRLIGGFDAAALEAYLRIAPWDRDLASAVYLRRTRGGSGTPADLEAAYGRLLDYDLRAMKARAELVAGDADRYRSAYARIVAVDPDSGLGFGAYLAGRGLDGEAAAAYQKAVDEAFDRVAVANHTGWLVDYYLDHGERDRALAVARDAAEVGSSAGLLTLAHFFERAGRCADAESRLKARAERYPSSSEDELQCFYRRCVDESGDPRFRSEARDARRQTLGSEEPVTLASLSGPPPSGVMVVETAPKFEALGLVKGAVLVAIDGLRVRDLEHYRCLRSLGDGSSATAIVWQGGAYREIQAPLRRPHPALTFRSLTGSR